MVQTHSPWARASALAVHFYTATGAVLAFLMVLAAVRGEAGEALWFGVLAMVIDGTDGTLARRFRVKEQLLGSMARCSIIL